jgi:hypothetical protein
MKYLDLSFMTSSTIFEERNQWNPCLEGERRLKKQKCIKNMEEMVSLKLRAKTRLNDLMELEEWVVIC